MMTRTIQIQDAQRRLPELVDTLTEGNEIVITRDDQPIARLTSVSKSSQGSTSLKDLQPASVGQLLRPIFDEDDDLLGEMSAAGSAPTPRLSSI
jgi:prevent-host-death family protein